MKLSLLDLYSLPRACIIALEHDITKRVALCISHGVLGTIERLIASNEISNYIGKDDPKEYSFRFYESINNRNILLNHLAYYETLYEDKGYLLIDIKNGYETRLKGLYYKTRLEVGKDGLAYLKIADKLNKQLLVGIFDKMEDALEFKRDYIDSQLVITPVIAINRFTREYYRR